MSFWNSKNKFPYTDNHDANLDYMMTVFENIKDEWHDLYVDLVRWKGTTTLELNTWKTNALAQIDQYETDFRAEIAVWKATTEQDIGVWEQGVLADLGTWRANFETLFATTFSNLSQIKTDAEAARDAAALSADAALESAEEAESSAESVSASLTQIATNANDISDLKTHLPPINAQLKSEFNERNYETGHYAGAFQYGNLVKDGNALVYSKMTTRICSKLDCGIHAEAGEKIGLSDYTNAVYYTFCIKDDDKSVVMVSGWKSAEIIAPYPGSYFFIIRNATEAEITDTASLAELLYVKRRNSLNSKIEGVYSFSSSDFAQGTYIPLPKSWASGEKKRITTLVNVKAGQILDVKPSAQNYIDVKIYDENGTLLQSYDFNNYQMRVPVKNDGLLAIKVANKKSYNSSTEIVPTDYASEILLYSVSTSSIRTVEHITKNNLFNGSYDITSDSFVPNDNRRICLVKYVPKGTVISVKSVNLFIAIFKSVNKTSTTIKDFNKIPFNVTIDEDCIIYMVFGNGHSYNASTAITTDDYNSDIYFIYNEGQENKKAFKVMNPNIITVDHRGYTTEAPENTLPALYLSKKHGFDWVEFDVQMTSDNIPVLLHDATIDRTSNGTGAIADMTYEQALQYGYGKGYADYADVKVPTLEEACELCKRIALHPLIELKDDVTWDASKVAIVMNAVAKMGMLDDAIFTSFSYTALELVKADYPKAKLVYTQNAYSANGVQSAKALQNNDNTVYYSIGVHSALSNIDALAQSRLPIVAWTIEDVYGLVNQIPSVAKFIITTDLNATGYLYNLENVKY